MKIVVGLGNPGQKYKDTRHNVGFDVLASIADRYVAGRPKAKFNAEVVEIVVNNQKTVLISPLTFMNLSGKSVRPALDFFKVSPEDLMIVCDDINLDVGRIRIRPSGSAGGQNGLKDIFQRAGTDKIPRLRLGVGRVPPRWDAADYVLGKFDAHDRQLVDTNVERAVDAIELWVGSGIQAAMNQFNADPNQQKKQTKNQATNKSKQAQQPSDSDAPNTITPESD